MSDIVLISSEDDPEQSQRINTLSIDLEFEPEEIREKYSLKAKPGRTSKLVLSCQESILNNISINRIAEGLNQAADLMYVAYNALSGSEIQATVSGLQKLLMDATAEASITIKSFKDKTDPNKPESVVNQAFDGFSRLFQGQESFGITKLVRCGKVAEKMAVDANNLAQRFQAIVDKAQLAAEAAIKEKVADEATRKKLQEKLSLVQAVKQSTEVLQSNIQTELTKVQEEYEQAREREKVEGERAFITGIVGATVGALAAGVGSVAQAIIAVKSPVGLPGGYVPPTQPGGNKPNGQAPSPEVQQQKESLTKELQEKQAAKAAIDREKKENEAKIAKAEAISKDTQSTAQAKAEAEKEKSACEAKRADIEQRLKKAQEAIDNLTSGLGNVSAQLAQISTQSYSAAETASKQKMAYYEHRNKLAEQNREALANLAQYAVELKYTTDATKNIEMAIRSLEFAITALNGVVSELKKTVVFWQNMANYCKDNLAGTSLTEDIKYIEQNYDPMNRKLEYAKPLIIYTAVYNIAQWVALYNVCDQYLIEVQKVFDKVNTNHAHPIPEAQLPVELPKLAQKVLDSTEKQTVAVDSEIRSLELEMLSVNIAAKAVS
ncbi:hypothetical protein ACE1B6_03400 [Aerosakkonemataceae cyanobacterium BLCC-F154]|uniref:Uncharacterized protein n=1 Tax=Floridaenema fluviatile BLCC-F154 TaxID=3153640 RepID=A0ABV4Y674_9CYAN